jgi:hypothetical protein
VGYDPVTGHFIQADTVVPNAGSSKAFDRYNYGYNDPNYPRVDARQTFSNFGPSEQWADAFANYVAGNINLNNSEGKDMYEFVSSALSQYIGVP